MAYDGNGTFNRLYNWQQDAANGIDIMADRMDGEMNGMAAGMSLAFLRDGQAAMTANADMGNNRVIRVADPNADTDAVNRKYVTDNFLSNSGSPTIKADNPWLYFEEDSATAETRNWRIGLSSSQFTIQPLQSDKSPGTDFGKLVFYRGNDGLINIEPQWGPSRVQSGNGLLNRSEMDARYPQLATENTFPLRQVFQGENKHEGVSNKQSPV